MSIQTTQEAIGALQQAQITLDQARSKTSQHQSLAQVLISDTERHLLDGLTRVERVKRFLAITRSKAVSGRWPIVATKQREDAELMLDEMTELLSTADSRLQPIREKIAQNPALSEAMIADVSRLNARVLSQCERLLRILIEAGIGRE